MGHPKATEKTGLGQKRPNAAKWASFGSPTKRFRHTSLKLVSTKQARRTAMLHAKLKRMMIVQELAGELPRCQVCGRIKLEGENGGVILYPCHIIPRARHTPNMDSYSNLYVGCSFCNGKQGSTVFDPRPEWFKIEAAKLDREMGSHETK